MSQTSGRFIMALVAGAAIAGLVNVYADHSEVDGMARRTACAPRDLLVCRTRTTRIARTPFYQELTFSDGYAAKTVRCTRTFYLIGDYSCAVR